MTSRAPSRRVFGLETEYALTAQGGQMDAEQRARVLFEPINRRYNSTNVFLPSGGRLYLDVGSHPEYATAECDRLEDLLIQERYGDQLVQSLAGQANERLEGQKLHIIKNNRDQAGHGYGCHENYLLARSDNYWDQARSLLPFLVTRQLISGAGWLADDGSYRLSQRADQMWNEVANSTTRSRPMINTRDEPHAQGDKWRRLHIIVADSNLSQAMTLFKVGSVDLLLDAIEHGQDFSDLTLANAPKAIREVSKDLRGATRVDLADGRRLGAAQIQGEFLERLSQYAQTELDLDPWQTQVLNIWRTCLKAISGGDWEKVSHLVDWAAKKKLLQAYANRHQLAPNDVRLKRLALAYHDLDPASGLRTKLERSGALATFIDANKANCPTAPATTRAHLRGSLIEAAQGAGRLVKADWVNIKLEDGSAHQFELLDPLANSDWRVDKLLSELQSSQIDPFWQGTGV